MAPSELVANGGLFMIVTSLNCTLFMRAALLLLYGHDVSIRIVRYNARPVFSANDIHTSAALLTVNVTSASHDVTRGHSEMDLQVFPIASKLIIVQPCTAPSSRRRHFSI